MTTWQKLKNKNIFLLVILMLLSNTIVFAESEYITNYAGIYRLKFSPIKSFEQEVAVLKILEGQIVEVDSVPMGLSEALYFNKDGFLSARVFFDNGPYRQVYWERFYDSRCHKESFFYRYDRRNDYGLNAYIKYEYDSECHIMREINFFYDEMKYEPHPLQTDEDGNIIPFQRYHSSGVRSEKVFNRFNGTLEQYSYDEDGTVTYYSSEVYEFLKSKQNKTSSRKSSEERIVDASQTYWTDDRLFRRVLSGINGKVIEERFFSIQHDILVRSDKYSLKGHLYESNFFDENGDLTSSEKCQYEYDNFENWVSKTCTNYSLNNGKLESRMPYRLLRKIEYYLN